MTDVDLEATLPGAPCELTRDDVSAAGIPDPAARAVWTAPGSAEVCPATATAGDAAADVLPQLEQLLVRVWRRPNRHGPPSGQPSAAASGSALLSR